MTDRDLLRCHVEAVWDLRLPSLNAPLDELVLTQTLPPWSVYLATLPQAQIVLWHPQVLPEQRALLLNHAQHAAIAWEPTAAMRREVIFQVPQITSSQLAHAERLARRLTEDDADRINAFDPNSAAYLLHPHRAPCVGVIVDDRVVSIAHSSRRTSVACELGIDTLTAARQRGYATGAVTLWTVLVQQHGLLPIYSAFAANQASLRLAQTVGYVPSIAGVYGPVAEEDE